MPRAQSDGHHFSRHFSSGFAHHPHRGLGQHSCTALVSAAWAWGGCVLGCVLALEVPKLLALLVGVAAGKAWGKRPARLGCFAGSSPLSGVRLLALGGGLGVENCVPLGVAQSPGSELCPGRCWSRPLFIKDPWNAPVLVSDLNRKAFDHVGCTSSPAALFDLTADPLSPSSSLCNQFANQPPPPTEALVLHTQRRERTQRRECKCKVLLPLCGWWVLLRGLLDQQWKKVSALAKNGTSLALHRVGDMRKGFCQCFAGAVFPGIAIVEEAFGGQK